MNLTNFKPRQTHSAKLVIIRNILKLVNADHLSYLDDFSRISCNNLTRIEKAISAIVENGDKGQVRYTARELCTDDLNAIVSQIITPYGGDSGCLRNANRDTLAILYMGLTCQQ